MIALLLVLSFVSAISVDIDVKPIFSTGEKVFFNYTIFSETSKNIEYSSYVQCPNAPEPLLTVKNAVLEASVPFTETYTYMSSLGESIPSQECKATVWIEKPEQESYWEYFSIQTNPAFDLNVLTCKDVDCNEQTRVFIKNDEIYLNYNSTIDDLTVIAIVTSPSGSSEQINLPGSFSADEVGSYSLQIGASKQGYENVLSYLELGVIAEEPNIGYTPVSELTGEEKEPSNLTVPIIVTVLIIIALGVLIYFLIKKRKTRK